MAKKSNKRTFKYCFDTNRVDTYSKKIEDIDEAIAKAEESDVAPLTRFLNMAKEQNVPLCFFGAGGAMSPVAFAVQLCHAQGMVAQAMTPMEVMTLSPEVLSGMCFLAISGSGGPSDMVAACEYLIKHAPEHAYCLTTADIDHKNRYGQLSNRVGQLFKNSGIVDHAICVNLSLHKDGFVGTKKHVGMAVLLYRAFYPEAENLVDELILPEEEPFELRLPEGMEPKDITDLHILYGALGKSAAVDMEGRMLEGGVVPAMVTDLKNFTHGRHTYINAHPKSTILFLLSPRDEKFVGELLKLLPKDKPVIFIRTKNEGILGAIELMIRTFYLSIDLSAPHGINIFKPDATPEWGKKMWSLKLSGAY